MSAATIKQEIAAMRARLDELEERVDAGLMEDELGPDVTQADLDAWIDRNLAALEKRSVAGHEALARGECFVGTAEENRALVLQELRGRATKS